MYLEDIYAEVAATIAKRMLSCTNLGEYLRLAKEGAECLDKILEASWTYDANSNVLLTDARDRFESYQGSTRRDFEEVELAILLCLLAPVPNDSIDEFLNEITLCTHRTMTWIVSLAHEILLERKSIIVE